MKKCESCNGGGTLGGSFYVWESCHECGGTGEIDLDEEEKNG